MDSKFIAARITDLRLKKNVSEYQMSLDLGRNKTYIQSITSGRNLPKMNHFLDICDYLGVTPMEFFDDELHHIPLQQKANELLKQLDEEDLLAVISILNRLAAKHKFIMKTAGIRPHALSEDISDEMDLVQFLQMSSTFLLC